MIDLNAAIADLVAAEVNAKLEPYRAILNRMAAFVGAAPAHRGPGRPRKTEAAAAAPAPASRKRRGRRTYRVSKKAALRAAKNLTEGQKVSYKQGRGSFEAKVVSIDSEKGTVTVERIKDGKKVTRPAAKVTAG
jgi:hypothetical protein